MFIESTFCIKECLNKCKFYIRPTIDLVRIIFILDGGGWNIILVAS